MRRALVCAAVAALGACDAAVVDRSIDPSVSAGAPDRSSAPAVDVVMGFPTGTAFAEVYDGADCPVLVYAGNGYLMAAIQPSLRVRGLSPPVEATVVLALESGDLAGGTLPPEAKPVPVKLEPADQGWLEARDHVVVLDVSYVDVVPLFGTDATLEVLLVDGEGRTAAGSWAVVLEGG